ncbi:uncharacterized protein FIBRA_04000 [Fibroporia radiculosa]|uniref:Transmembrane protein n=1 Tax=Fibroporia radiculosa TaxID=599839 RepID=J4HWA6_9APHY|nr:uncharacterized protein FIBRA_04000 [Fibroporia radiculosa]CCM01927.1 predicted protein [Fibroporia radiculosa]
MAALNVSLDDSSPLLSYSPSNAWLDASANDTLAPYYAYGSLHTTSVARAEVALTFNGTGFWLFGGLRPHYGTFIVSVDGTQILYGNASSTQPVIDALLAGASGLKMGEHRVVLQNAGTGPIDLDAVVFETSIGTTSRATVKETVIDNTSPNFKYGPSTSDWSMVTDPAYFNNSLQYSFTQNAQASLTFSGDAVAVYGTVAPTHANYSITLDGKTSQQFNASDVSTIHAQTLLFFGQDLGPKEHTLIINGNPGKDAGRYVDVDFVTVYSVSGNTSTDASTVSSSTSLPMVTGLTMPNNLANGTNSVNTISGDASRLSSGTIAGIVIGSLLGLLALLLLLFIFLRRKGGVIRAKFGFGGDSDKPDALTPALPMQEPDVEAAYGLDSNAFHEDEKQYQASEPVPMYTVDLYSQRDEYGKRMTSASRATRWSQTSYGTMSTHWDDPSLPRWSPPRVSAHSIPNLQYDTVTHSRNVSDTSTIVHLEVESGLSQVVLRPRLSNAPRIRCANDVFGLQSAPVRLRPPSPAFSVTQYYFEA